MPVDARLWLGGAAGRAPSSYPACLAVKAAAEQGLDGPVLRAPARGLPGRPPRAGHDGRARWRPSAACPGSTSHRFAVDLRSNAIVEAFGADLDVAREREPAAAVLARRRAGGWRARPASRALREAALRGGRRAAPARCRRPRRRVRRLGRVATAEVAAACDLPGPRAPAELWRLASEWRVRPERGPRRRALGAGLGGREEVARVGELGAQPRAQPRVELRGAALGDPDRLAGLAQRQPLDVEEDREDLLALGQPREGGAERVLRLLAGGDVEGVVAGGAVLERVDALDELVVVGPDGDVQRPDLGPARRRRAARAAPRPSCRSRRRAPRGWGAGRGSR